MRVSLKKFETGIVRNGRFTSSGAAPKTARNPLPKGGRFVAAKVKRKSNGDLEIVVEKNSPKKAAAKKAAKKTAKKKTTKKK